MSRDGSATESASAAGRSGVVGRRELACVDNQERAGIADSRVMAAAVADGDHAGQGCAAVWGGVIGPVGHQCAMPCTGAVPAGCGWCVPWVLDRSSVASNCCAGGSPLRGEGFSVRRCARAAITMVAQWSASNDEHAIDVGEGDGADRAINMMDRRDLITSYVMGAWIAGRPAREVAPRVSVPLSG